MGTLNAEISCVIEHRSSTAGLKVLTFDLVEAESCPGALKSCRREDFAKQLSLTKRKTGNQQKQHIPDSAKEMIDTACKSQGAVTL